MHFGLLRNIDGINNAKVTLASVEYKHQSQLKTHYSFLLNKNVYKKKLFNMYFSHLITMYIILPPIYRNLLNPHFKEMRG